MFCKLRVNRAASILLFVRMFYGQQSIYMWQDSEATVHDILQGEGGEQGDPLMPALFSLGEHEALEAARARLQPDEILVAFLDDIYFIT